MCGHARASSFDNVDSDVSTGSQKIAAGGSFAVRPIGSSGNPFGDLAVGGGHLIAGDISGMTIKHEVWLADAIAGSAMLFVLYFVLVEFSKARLP
jgi:hypothetical protein